MRDFFKIFFLLSVLFMVNGCSTAYINPRLDDFYDATEMVGNSIIKVFAELQSEEMNLRAEEAVNKQFISPSDLEPGVFTFEHLKARQELISAVVNYTKMLAVLFETDHREEIRKYTKIVEGNLNTISIGNKNLFSDKEKGIFAMISVAIPEALSYTKKKKFVLKLMKDIQPLLEKISKKLEDELRSVKILADNFYLRSFREKVVEKWPGNKTKRLKYSKLGVQIIKKRREINYFTEEVINALKMIPSTHLKIRESMGRNKNVFFALKELVNYGYRVKKSYEKFSNRGE